MSDDEGPGVMGKIQHALCMLCVGIVLFPASLGILGWNEKDTVCKENKIIYTEKNVEKYGCTADDAKSAEGKDAFFSCDIDRASLQSFTPEVFNPGKGLDFKDIITFTGVEGKQVVSMFQCVETVHTSTRTENGKSRTVKTYSYATQWSQSRIDSSTFHNHGTECGASFSGNPAWPSNLNMGTESERANSVKAGAYSIEQHLMDKFKAASVVVGLGSFKSKFAANVNDPSVNSVSKSNLMVDSSGSHLTTCSGSAKVGCIKIEYLVNDVNKVSVWSKIVAGGATSPIEVPSSWGCKGGEFDGLYEGEHAEDSLYENFRSSNKVKSWLIRVGGILLAWAAIYCCFAPISTAADLMGDCLDMIPCCGDFLEDMLEGVVGVIVCAASMGIGCSCAFFVIAIVWVAMRPLYGSLMLGAACICFTLAAGGLYMHRQNNPREGKRRRERTVDMEEGDEEDIE